MVWSLSFADDARKELGKLPLMMQRRLWSFLTQRVLAAANPRIHGQALSGPLKGLWRYRVGDYRIICSIEDATVTVLVVHVGHRSSVYKVPRPGLPRRGA